MNNSPLSEVILGYKVYGGNEAGCIDRITAWIASGEKGKYLVCANPYSLAIADRDAAFSEAIRNADLLVPDGAGILLASKILGGKIRERITGSDVFAKLSAALNKQGRASYFFLGSTEETLAGIAAKMQVDFPGIRIAGAYAPPYKAEFDAEDNRRMIEAINGAGPDVLWVGMTAPKQEKWICQHKDKLNVKFIGAVGAVFDFYTGKVKRSHPWFLEHGLEWLPRLLQEPRRLWRRTFVSAPVFLLKVLRQRIFGK